MTSGNLTFEETKKQSDLAKEVPGESNGEIRTKTPLDNTVDVRNVDLKLSTTADLYHSILYTVVPKNFDLTQDITPDVQDFDKKWVILWDDYSALFKFKSEVWQKVKVQLPPDILGRQVLKHIGDTYVVSIVSADWVKSQSSPPQYVE